MRKDDQSFQDFKRTERLYSNNKGWYFVVRQGAEFGPYSDKHFAEKCMRSFVNLLSN